MKTIIAVDGHVLADLGTRGHPLPFCWYADHGPAYKAQGGDEGLIYIGGFSTREAAEAWAVKQGILHDADGVFHALPVCSSEKPGFEKQNPLPLKSDDQGEL